VSNSNYICETENVAAYIEGDLDPVLASAFEEHLTGCSKCAAELNAQRLFMCELDSALASPLQLSVPPNFAQVVAVHAESDMRGLRERREHARALRLCIILSLAAFALLGFASSKAVFLSARSVAGKILRVVSFLADLIFNAVSGFTLILRVVARGLMADSRLAGVAGLLLMILAIAFLSRLISRYHRTRVIE
jgi:anti-sigma factor RsiW